ncbi:DUF6650 family protein [Pectinatus frisingensis]|uniref:DUF6650 family protein n=1 Tax=Pectinatus frisingensis TaxID=865 RepID=UPI002ED85A51
MGGISWEYTENERRQIQKLFYFLESKRLLINPADMELPDQCAQSAVEIKEFLVGLLCGFRFSKDVESHLKELCVACNVFLDEINFRQQPHIIYKNNSGDWADSNFSTIMKTFRKVFRTKIAYMEENYGLSFDNHIPEKY